MVASKNKSGMLRSILQFVFINLIIKEKLSSMPRHGKCLDWLLFSLEENGSQCLDLYFGWQTFARILIDQNRSLNCLGVIFNPLGEIDGIADTSIRRALLRASISRDHPACGDPDPNLDLCFVEDCLLLIEPIEQADHFECGAHGILTVFLARNRCTKDRHESIANHLIDGAMVTGDGSEHQREEIVEQVDDLRGVFFFRVASEGANVGEHWRTPLRRSRTS